MLLSFRLHTARLVLLRRTYPRFILRQFSVAI